MNFEEEALGYHEADPAGKIETRLSKPLNSQHDLSVAYSPGVAGPCRRIHEDEDLSFRYTGRGNLVGVITNGSAVLGLGNIGPSAAKPVMEGKAMLFKKFANIDVFDVEVSADSSDAFISAVQALEPTFGGINLEDIRAPECFYIEEKLRETMKIPVFHDDQHGTAIIASAAFINALEITKRDISNTKVVFSGGGAAAIACANLFLDLGLKPDSLLMCDSRGVIHKGRDAGMNPYKARFAVDTDKRTLADAMEGADVFVGVSAAGILKPDMVKGMAANPIIFALANPDPEILPSEARKIRPDAIIATGRSDFPNQVNNVLGFPFIFRGALDVRATTINDEMKKAAVYAIAELAKEDVPEEVLKVYAQKKPFKFDRDYLIPKPVDPRVLLHVAPAVAKAAMDSGVARRRIDLTEYTEHIERILGPTRTIIRKIRKELVEIGKKRGRRVSIVLPHGHDSRLIRAAARLSGDEELDLILLGQKEVILRKAKELELPDFEKMVKVINPREDGVAREYAEDFFNLRKRKGIAYSVAEDLVKRRSYYAAMMIKNGQADGMVGGLLEPYTSALRPVLEVVGTRDEIPLAGIKILVFRHHMYFIADCSINFDPTAEQVADIAVATANMARFFTKDELRVALLSFSTFGSNSHPEARKMARAAELLAERKVDFLFDGEVQADVALNSNLQKTEYPFCNLDGKPANILIFPNLAAANTSYKLINNLTEAECIGPILVGTKNPCNILERGATYEEITDAIYLTAAQCIQQEADRSGPG